MAQVIEKFSSELYILIKGTSKQKQEIIQKYRYTNRKLQNNPGLLTTEYLVICVIINTYHVNNHMLSTMIRYTLELAYNLYKKKELLDNYPQDNHLINIAKIIINHFNIHSIDLINQIYEVHHLSLFIKLIEVNLPITEQLCIQTKILSERNDDRDKYKQMRLLSLAECQRIQIDIDNIPQQILLLTCIRGVPCFGQRTVATEINYYQEYHKELGNVVHNHVCGSGERSSKPNSNPSQTLSVSHDIIRVWLYLKFYMQLIPYGILIDINSDSVEETSAILRYYNKKWITPINISNCHKEGIPKSITYFPQNTVNNIFSVYMDIDGNLKLYKKFLNKSVFYSSNILKRHDLEDELKSISDNLERSDDFQSRKKQKLK